MESKLLKYICEEVPIMLEVKTPKVGGAIARLIYEKESADGAFFNAEEFESARERAKLAMPYQVKEEKMEQREHVLAVLEYVIHHHREKSHGEDNADRMAQIKASSDFTLQEKDIMAMEFWN